ncbi:DUF6090 family protein [Aestuariivivens sediminicola]|uniref:DUF6090 family protein n=1 Tax=Aestuariivivens sediminicola TaxID=2913560 RepID=UPI001F581F4E|nr:DUF6090 family protein [Aestuariivivens sediminicola]
MIKFFRRRRQRLLSENKFSKYLVYAVGEIALVVIGILIALQINNANEDKKDRVYEKKMLIEIKHALEKDVDYFKNHLVGSRLQKIQNAALFFENYLISDSINRDSINHHFNGLTTGFHLTYNNGPYEALKSTGIDRVSNDSLRNMIIDLYEFELPKAAGIIEITMDNYFAESKKLEEQLKDDLSVEIKNGEVTYLYNRMKDVNLRTNPSFLELLSWGSSSSKSVINFFDSIVPQMEELIITLDKELKKK